MLCGACNCSDREYEGKFKVPPFIPIPIPIRGENGEVSNPPSLFACPVCGTVKVSQDWLNEVRRSKGEKQ